MPKKYKATKPKESSQNSPKKQKIKAESPKTGCQYCLKPFSSRYINQHIKTKHAYLFEDDVEISQKPYIPAKDKKIQTSPKQIYKDIQRRTTRYVKRLNHDEPQDEHQQPISSDALSMSRRQVQHYNSQDSEVQINTSTHNIKNQTESSRNSNPFLNHSILTRAATTYQANISEPQLYFPVDSMPFKKKVPRIPRHWAISHTLDPIKNHHVSDMDVEIDRKVTVLLYNKAIEDFRPHWRFPKLLLPSGCIEILRRLLLGFGQVYLLNRVSKEMIKMATTCPQTRKLFKQLCSNIFERYINITIRRNLLMTFKAMLDENNGYQIFKLHSDGFGGTLSFDIFEFLGLDPVQELGFSTQINWAPGKNSNTRNIKKGMPSIKSDFYAANAREMIKLGDQIARLLAFFPKNLLNFKYSTIGSKHECMLIILRQFVAGSRKSKPQGSKCSKADWLLRKTKEFHDLSWELIKYDSTAHRGTDGFLMYNISSESDYYQSLLNERAKRQKDKFYLAAERMVYTKPPVFKACSNDKVYLIQTAAGRDINWITECDCEQHKTMRPIEY